MNEPALDAVAQSVLLAERALQAAMRASDVDQLDRLLHPELLAVGPTAGSSIRSGRGGLSPEAIDPHLDPGTGPAGASSRAYQPGRILTPNHRARLCALCTGSNPGSKLSATERNSEQLRPPESAESQRLRLDHSGWGPGGRRFKSCLPDNDHPAKGEEHLVGALPRGAFQGANFAPHLHPAGESQFGSPSRVGNLRPQGLEPGGRWFLNAHDESSRVVATRSRRGQNTRCSPGCRSLEALAEPPSPTALQHRSVELAQADSAGPQDR